MAKPLLAVTEVRHFPCSWLPGLHTSQDGILFSLQILSKSLSESEVKVTYSQVWWPILWIRALHFTHQVHTHTHTAGNIQHRETHHPEQGTAIYAAAPGGAVEGSVPCTSVMVSRGWRECCTFTHPFPPPDNPCRTETRSHNFSIMSPTL